MNAEQLEAEFTPKGILNGRTLLLDAATALEYVAAATANKIEVLGIDTFCRVAAGIQPDMAHILDLSTERSLQRGNKLAADFIKQRSALGLLFDVVLGDGGR